MGGEGEIREGEGCGKCTGSGGRRCRGRRMSGSR